MNRKSQLAVIFATVFLYLVGFGIVIPIIPILSTQFGASSLQAGLLLSVYSLMQFLFSPFWGQLSDKYGRRPILLLCLLGEAISYIVFGLARSLEMLFVARLLAGFFGASISTASAYISDITPPNERSKGMALIGAAFGLGFVVGPALGGGLALWGRQISDAPHFESSFAAYWVSGICLLTFIFALKFLKETLNPENKVAEEKKNRLQKVFMYLKRPTVGQLVGVFFLSSLAMSSMEATLILFMGQKFAWTLKEVSFGFAYIGVIIVITQGFIVRRLLPKLGERKVLRAGLAFMAVGLSTIAFAPNLAWMCFAMTALSIGNGLTNPSTLGSISLLASPKEQGGILGVSQSLSSLGRIIGPAIGGLVYKYNVHSPFVMSGIFAAVGLSIVLAIYQKIPSDASGPKAEKEDAETLQFKELNKLGYFQFENLIQNRVPFMLALIDTNLDGWYTALSKMHVERYQKQMTPENALQIIQENALDKSQGIVIVDAEGQIAQKTAVQLSKLGFGNVFYLEGGLKQLAEDRKQHGPA